MEGLVFEWNEACHHGRVADAENIYFNVKRGDVEGRFDLAVGDRVTFDRGPDVITKRNGRTLKSAVNVRIVSMGDL